MFMLRNVPAGINIAILSFIYHFCCFLFMTTWWYLDVHLITILIDFHFNYSEAFYFDINNTVYYSAFYSDTDNTVYSSGGGRGTYYDVITDTIIQRENPGQNPPTHDTTPPNSNCRTDTSRLADFLESKHGYGLDYIGIKFSKDEGLSPKLLYYSKVTRCVRHEYPELFFRDGRTTLSVPRVYNFIRNLDKNYPELNGFRGDFV